MLLTKSRLFAVAILTNASCVCFQCRPPIPCARAEGGAGDAHGADCRADRALDEQRAQAPADPPAQVSEGVRAAAVHLYSVLGNGNCKPPYRSKREPRTKIDRKFLGKHFVLRTRT